MPGAGGRGAGSGCFLGWIACWVMDRFWNSAEEQLPDTGSAKCHWIVFFKMMDVGGEKRRTVPSWPQKMLWKHVIRPLLAFKEFG